MGGTQGNSKMVKVSEGSSSPSRHHLPKRLPGKGYVFLLNVTGTSRGRGVTHISVMLTGPNQPIHNPAFLCLQLCGGMEMTHEILQDTI